MRDIFPGLFIAIVALVTPIILKLNADAFLQGKISAENFSNVAGFWLVFFAFIYLWTNFMKRIPASDGDSNNRIRRIPRDKKIIHFPRQ